MNKTFNEEIFAQYALNELDVPHPDDVETFLQTDEEARRTVAEYRQIAELAKKAMKLQPSHELDEFRRRQILQQAKKQPERPKFSVERVLLLSAAAVFVIIVLGLFVLEGPHKSAQRMAAETPAPVAKASRGVSPELQEGGAVERKDVGGTTFGYDMNGDGISENVPLYKRPAQSGAEEYASPNESNAAANKQPDRYLIKTASLTIETDDARKASADFTAQAGQLGGYVANLREQTDGLGRHSVNIEVRVPAEKLDEMLQGLSGFGQILNKQVNAQDVTEQYVDDESRIRNLKKTEERLLDHLSKTSMIENTLKIETELNRVREQLEVLEGRHRVLSHRVAYSSINTTFTEKPKAEPVVPAQSFSLGKVATEAIPSLVEYGRTWTAGLIWAGVWMPVWLPIALIGWWLWRRIRRNWVG